MSYCPKCRLDVRGRKRCCPLCQGTLIAQAPAYEADETGRTNQPAPFLIPEDPAFPILPARKVSRLSAFRLITFIFIAGEIVFGGLHVLTGFKLHWIWLVMLLFLMGWLDLVLFFYMQSNLLKLVSTEILAALLITILIDAGTGWHGWSIAWTLPFGLLAHALAIFILAKALHLHLQEYVMYFLLGTIISLLQIIPMALHLNPVRLPAVICMMLFLILFAGIIIFGHRDLKTASARRFNI